MARARERQKLLQCLDKTDEIPHSTSPKASSQPNLPATSKIIQDSVIKTSSSEGNIPPKFARQNSVTRVSSEISSTNNSSLTTSKTLNIQNDNFNMEIKVKSSENVRVEVQIEEHNEDEDMDDKNEGGLRKDAKSRLDRLGKLYAGQFF